MSDIPDFLKNNPSTLIDRYGDDASSAANVAAGALGDDGDEEAASLVTPITDEELWEFVNKYLNIQIPRNSCGNPDHISPFKAFSEAFFARHPRVVWWGSRGFSGKSVLLSTLGLTEALALGAAVTVLGGSGEQSQRVLGYMKGIDTNLHESFLAAPNAPRWMLRGDVTKRKTFFKNGGMVDALMASDASVRGPHPQRLRGDEIDSMKVDIWDAVQGQPMAAKGIKDQVVGCSTWQVPNGTMTREFQLAREMGWPIRTWCLPPGATVTLGDGSIREVQDIKLGDIVLTGKGNKKPVSKIWTRNVSENLVKINVQGTPDPILITKEHKIPTQRGWVRADDIEKNDLVFDTKIPFRSGGNFLDGWVLGLFLAEGSWPPKENWSTMYFGVHKREQEYVAEQLQLWIDNKVHVGGRSIPGQTDGGRVTIRDTFADTNGAVVECRHSELRDFLQEWTGYAGTQYTKKLLRLPEEEDFAEGVLEGWLFGDGYNAPSSNNRIGYSVSPDLAFQMWKIATSLGWSTNLKHYPNAKSDKELWQVSVSLYSPPVREKYVPVYNTIRQLSSVNAPKEEMYAAMVEAGATKEYNGNTYPRYDFLRRWVDVREGDTWKGQASLNIPVPDRVSENSVARKVTSVTTVPYTGLVYDLTVDDDHTFHTNGIVVSNCYNCVLESNGGWLSEEAVERKKQSIPKHMFEVEYDLAHPTAEGQAFDYEAIEEMFDKSIGTFMGEMNKTITVEGPVTGGQYSVGADWAKSRDKTWIVVLRTDVEPCRLVAVAHLGRIPFPDMVAKFNELVTIYDAYAVHEATGIGSVIQDYLEVYSEGIHLMGKRRNRIFSEYIAGVERGEIKMPMIESMYNEHRWTTVDDLYAPSGHPPDSVVAMALAYEASSSSELLI